MLFYFFCGLPIHLLFLFLYIGSIYVQLHSKKNICFDHSSLGYSSCLIWCNSPALMGYDQKMMYKSDPTSTGIPTSKFPTCPLKKSMSGGTLPVINRVMSPLQIFRKEMGNWGCNPCTWSYFTLLITVFFAHFVSSKVLRDDSLRFASKCPCLHVPFTLEKNARIIHYIVPSWCLKHLSVFHSFTKPFLEVSFIRKAFFMMEIFTTGKYRIQIH